MFSQYSELQPISSWNRWRVWGTLASFNGFRVLASLLPQRCSTGVNKLCTMFGHLLGWYIIHFGDSCPWRNSARCKIHFASESCVLLFRQRYCTALEQWASAKHCGVVQWMELRNSRSSSVSTESATCIPRAAITLVIGPHSSTYTCKHMCELDYKATSDTENNGEKLSLIT